MYRVLATLALAALAAKAVRAARPLDPPDVDLLADPFEDALPSSVRVAVEYIAYYLTTSCNVVEY